MNQATISGAWFIEFQVIEQPRDKRFHCLCGSEILILWYLIEVAVFSHTDWLSETGLAVNHLE
jgi:uncharacterized protein YqhQ